MKKVLIFGVGKTGLACGDFLTSKGWDVTYLKDQNDTKPPMASKGQWEITNEDLKSFDLIIRSPGVPMFHPLLKQLKQLNKTIWSELELVSFFNPLGHYIGITGTNGKTTTATMLYQILKNYYNDVKMVGNSGIPLISQIASATKDSYFVVEISSFQLEDTYTFHPEISAITNLTPNHLDHVDSLEAYYDSKKRIFQSQTIKDYTIINQDDPNSVQLLNPPTTIITIGKAEKSDFRLINREIYKGSSKLVVLNNPIFDLANNQMNFLMATAIASLLKIPPTLIQKSAEAFQGITHRMELLPYKQDILVFNDSKSTTPESTLSGRKSIPEGQLCHLLIGGRNKKLDFSRLSNLTNTIFYFFGESRNELFNQIKHGQCFVTLGDAWESAQKNAQKGEIILFSPGCASFDAFSGFEARGDYFKQLVRRSTDEG